MSDAKIGLVEVFRSVQGEGYHAGRSAIFVRTAGCNLSCIFADGAVCDTPYQHSNLKVTIDELFKDHVIPLLEGVVPEPLFSGVRRPAFEEERVMLILTGGEPTMQPQFDALVDRGIAEGFYVAVETNGTYWREGLRKADWICVSPKDAIEQGSPALWHNQNPQDRHVLLKVCDHVETYEHLPRAEYRFVIGGPTAETPPYYPAHRHYVSPAVLADGSGMEWKVGGFPGFVPGALERCLQIVKEDPRWRISIQAHKVMGVR